MKSGRSLSGENFKKFFGLSRMTHSILDVAHPAIGALLVFGGFPPVFTVVIGLLAAFAGFTAVFALNDVMDYRVDREKMAKYQDGRSTFDIDSIGYRHPVAQGSLSYKAAIGWVVFWGLLSIVLACILRPVCAALLAAAVLLEAGYCRLLRVTPWKTLLSGCMVAVGGLAGVYAVDSAPPAGLIALFFIWAFTWEVGCRNITNDWSDLEEDIKLGIQTVPVRFGRIASSYISFALICATVAGSLLFPLAAAMRQALVYLVGALAAGTLLLIVPALRWVRDQRPESALRLFNRACLYPLAVCAVVAVLAAV